MSASENAEPQRRRMDCEIPYRLERGMKHSLQECKNLSPTDAF